MEKFAAQQRETPIKKYYWEDFKDRLASNGISGPKDEINSLMDSAASLTVDLLYYLSSLNEDEKKLLSAILKNPSKRKTYRTPNIKKVVQTLNVNRKLLSAYIDINFSPNIVRSVFGEIRSPEDLVLAYLHSDIPHKADLIVDEMVQSDDYYDVGYMLRNSDPITRAVFVKELLPSLIQAAVSPPLLASLISVLRSVATSKKSHYEFFLALEKFRTLLFMFGPVDAKRFKDFLRCIS